jgi:hypothetical protein
MQQVCCKIEVITMRKISEVNDDIKKLDAALAAADAKKAELTAAIQTFMDDAVKAKIAGKPVDLAKKRELEDEIELLELEKQEREKSRPALLAELEAATREAEAQRRLKIDAEKQRLDDVMYKHALRARNAIADSFTFAHADGASRQEKWMARKREAIDAIDRVLEGINLAAHGLTDDRKNINALVTEKRELIREKYPLEG